MSGLPCKRAYDGAVSLEPRHQAPAPAVPARYDQPARDVQPADPWVEAEPSVGGRFYGIRAADSVFQRRPDPGDEEGLRRAAAERDRPYGAGTEHVRLPPGAKAQHIGKARSR